MRLARLYIATLASLSTILVSTVHADPIYKDINNPKGIPDVYQGNDAYCQAAAWADGIWWFDQYKDGLANTAEDGWYDSSQSLFKDLRDRIYGGNGQKARSYGGVLTYIDAKRPDDFKQGGRGKPITSNWKIEHYNWKELGRAPAVDIEAKARESLNSDHKYTTLGVYLHEQGDAANDLKVPLENGNEGLWAHNFGYAGRQPDGNDITKTTDLFVAHGWEPSHENEAKPVQSAYYDEYSISIVDPEIAHYTNRLLRITDEDFFGSAGGLADDATIDYAVVANMSTLRDDGKGRYSYRYFNEGGQQQQDSGPYVEGAATIPQLVGMDHMFENFGEGPIYDIAFEIPLISTGSTSWIDDVMSSISLPSGWSLEIGSGDYIWDPNTTEFYTPPALFDQNGELDVEYRGLRITTETNPLLDGEFLTVDFLIDAAEIDFNAQFASAAWADDSRGYFTEWLGTEFVAVPEPGAIQLFLLGLLVLAVTHRRWFASPARRNAMLSRQSFRTPYSAPRPRRSPLRWKSYSASIGAAETGKVVTLPLTGDPVLAARKMKA